MRTRARLLGKSKGSLTWQHQSSNDYLESAIICPLMSVQSSAHTSTNEGSSTSLGQLCLPQCTKKQEANHVASSSSARACAFSGFHLVQKWKLWVWSFFECHVRHDSVWYTRSWKSMRSNKLKRLHARKRCLKSMRVASTLGWAITEFEPSSPMHATILIATKLGPCV